MEMKEPQLKRKRKNPKQRKVLLRLKMNIATTIDDAEIKLIHDQFQGYFTMEQVKSTLIANMADPDKKNKTINDLKYKKGKLYV